MQTNLERLGELVRRLSVTLPAAEIESEVETRLKRLSRTVKLHGFRPGKVPLKVVAQQFGMQVRQEVLGDAMQRSFGEAIREQNLKVAGYPRFDAAPPAGGAEFQYSATFEVYPDVAVGDIKGATIRRPVHEVTDADVEQTVEKMRGQRVRYEPAAREAQTGDRVTLDFHGTIDGQEFSGNSGKDMQAVLGEGRLLADFESNLTGTRSGTEKTFELRFPDDYHGKEVAGKTARFQVTVKEVAAPHLPQVDSEFAKVLGIADGDVSKMRAEIRANLEREIRLRLKNRVKEQVMQTLLDATPIETPQGLVQAEIERMQGAARQDLAARGVKVTDETPLPTDLFEKQAQRRVSLGLILAEVVKAHGLFAKPEQVRAMVEELAQSYERPEEMVKWYYGSQDRLREIESAVLEDNVVEWALGTATVEDTPISFDDLMGNKQ
ncbi:MAG: trigger factor [Betaproteobacteria bacterium]|nr:MAG: trigger factor [Betaproteobacteria bacterium SG8_41]UCF74991.1 MAG: trigger factor [Betaproteobacteria bacterium]